jgi:flagellar basal-body rod protein FlgF
MALQRQMEVLANNIANMNTPGFKGEGMLFSEYLAETEPGSPEDDLSMVVDLKVWRDHRQGALERTDNPLDLALEGDGFFVVGTPEGPRYTRNGRLTIDAERRLVDVNRLPVLGEGDQPITVPDGTGAIGVTAEGEVMAGTVPLGRLKVVTLPDMEAITPLGGGLYSSNQVAEPAEGTKVVQGMLEDSNVQPIVEMTRMIEVARQYEATQQMLQAEHQRALDAARRLAETRTS